MSRQEPDQPESGWMPDHVEGGRDLRVTLALLFDEGGPVTLLVGEHRIKGMLVEQPRPEDEVAVIEDSTSLVLTFVPISQILAVIAQW